MSETVSFKCPSCGGREFRLGKEPDSYKDFVGAPCNACGAVLTEAEIKRQASAFAVEALKQSFKRTRF
jgi:uncharacterized Zn finger protein